MVAKTISGNNLKYLGILLIFLYLFGCAGVKKQTVPVAKEEAVSEVPAGAYDESFDPLSLEDDDLVIERHTPAVSQSSSALHKTPVVSEKTGKALPDSLIDYEEVNGYRLQIFAGRSVEAATLAKTKAMEDFAPYGQKVYFIFEAPFYKIRIGDFRDRTQAEKARDLAKQMGYKEAFVVRSKVKVPRQ